MSATAKKVAPVKSAPVQQAIGNPPFQFEAYAIVPKGNLFCIRTITIDGDTVTKCQDNVEDLRVIQAAKLGQIMGAAGFL